MILRGIGIYVLSAVYFLGTFIMIQEWIYTPDSVNPLGTLLLLTVAFLVVSPINDLMVKGTLSGEITLKDDERFIPNGRVLRCEHCHATYKYALENLDQGRISCQNCGKTVSFNTAEIV